MKNIFLKALELMLSNDFVLRNIIQVTLRMTLSSSVLALLLGVPLGAFLASARFPGHKIITVLNRTLMATPPVVCGLLCYMMFSGVGPMRHFHLLYTVTGMIIAQVLLITPIVAGSIETYLSGAIPKIRETCRGLGLPGWKRFFLYLSESRYQIVSTYLLGFSRALAEVGAVSMVGGAIMFKTNVMTTAIMNYTSKGDFTTAIALGIILMLLALVLNVAVYFLTERFCK